MCRESFTVRFTLTQQMGSQFQAICPNVPAVILDGFARIIALIYVPPPVILWNRTPDVILEFNFLLYQLPC
jgi:hypothetical protein